MYSTRNLLKYQQDEVYEVWNLCVWKMMINHGTLGCHTFRQTHLGADHTCSKNRTSSWWNEPIKMISQNHLRLLVYMCISSHIYIYIYVCLCITYLFTCIYIYINIHTYEAIDVQNLTHMLYILFKGSTRTFISSPKGSCNPIWLYDMAIGP